MDSSYRISGHSASLVGGALLGEYYVVCQCAFCNDEFTLSKKLAFDMNVVSNFL